MSTCILSDNVISCPYSRYINFLEVGICIMILRLLQNSQHFEENILYVKHTVFLSVLEFVIELTYNLCFLNGPKEKSIT